MKALSMIVASIVAVVLIVPGSALAGTKAQADVDNVQHSSGPGYLVSAGAVEFSPTVTFTHQNFKREGYGNVDHFTQLDVKPTADAFETRANVLKAIQGHILAKAVYGGLFRRPAVPAAK